ncbi:hypothetical protein BDY21DRAFT_353644 [Lineolata rhizophorae]|uniref:Uncharacterized protein n=1 Tax=Lineolata rhizophorae TaxID=578093 RepID=A0A6A6NS93_9PEZI|nr:hypothetical protein BDY21DRAFT_353644 [Lineolata rhizophorae]
MRTVRGSARTIHRPCGAGKHCRSPYLQPCPCPCPRFLSGQFPTRSKISLTRSLTSQSTRHGLTRQARKMEEQKEGRKMAPPERKAVRDAEHPPACPPPSHPSRPRRRLTSAHHPARPSHPSCHRQAGLGPAPHRAAPRHRGRRFGTLRPPVPVPPSRYIHIPPLPHPQVPCRSAPIPHDHHTTILKRFPLPLLGDPRPNPTGARRAPEGACLPLLLCSLGVTGPRLCGTYGRTGGGMSDGAGQAGVGAGWICHTGGVGGRGRVVV